MVPHGFNTIYSVKNKLPGPASPVIATAGLVSIRLVSGYERGNSKTEYVRATASAIVYFHTFLSLFVSHFTQVL